MVWSPADGAATIERAEAKLPWSFIHGRDTGVHVFRRRPTSQPPAVDFVDAPDRQRHGSSMSSIHPSRPIAADYGAKRPKAAAKITDHLDVLLAFYDFPANGCICAPRTRSSKADQDFGRLCVFSASSTSPDSSGYQRLGTRSGNRVSSRVGTAWSISCCWAARPAGPRQWPDRGGC